MVTIANREAESEVAVAAQIAEPVAAAPAARAVDISAIPETPDELLKQWDAPKRSFVQIISDVLGSFWDSITGPGKTELERTNRKIWQHNRYLRSQGPHF